MPVIDRSNDDCRYEDITYIDYLISRFNKVQNFGLAQEEEIEKVGHVTPTDESAKL